MFFQMQGDVATYRTSLTGLHDEIDTYAYFPLLTSRSLSVLLRNDRGGLKRHRRGSLYIPGMIKGSSEQALFSSEATDHVQVSYLDHWPIRSLVQIAAVNRMNTNTLR